MAIGSVTNIITKTTMPIHLPELDLANRKSNAVAKIVGRLRARSRTPVHHNSNKPSSARALCESHELITAAIVIRLIDRVSASRQTIAIGDIDGFAERIVGRPVSALVNRITPRAARVPMPDFASKLGSQPVSQWPKPS